MKRIPILFLTAALISLAIATVLMFSGKDSPVAYNPVYDTYLSAYTQGEISRKSPILIRFAEEWMGEAESGQELPKNPFRFSPEIKGKASWQNSRTLAFVPDAPLPSGQVYTASVNLSEIVADIPEELEEFPFQFGAKHQGVSLELHGASLEEENLNSVSGIVKTVDYAEGEEIQQLFSASLEGKEVAINWNHNPQKKQHAFSIQNLLREKEDQELRIRWDGKPLGISLNGEESVTIAALGIFRHTQTYHYDEPEQHIVLEFSDPLVKDQDLSGLINIERSGVRTLIEGNQIKVYPTKRITGEIDLEIHPGIQSITGAATLEKSAESVIFSDVNPELRLVGKGTILPKSEKMPLIFEARGLRAIDVRVIKIYEKNIPQFLQVNQLSESKELKRVGQPIVKKRIDLDGNPDLNLDNWNHHSLDLAEMINADPGAIYEVALGFRRSYSFYTCGEESEAEEDVDMLELEENWYSYVQEAEDSYWDDYYYDYDDREDPCKQDYYHSERMIKRNVLASDLGIIAKQGTAGAMFAVTDLRSTEPKSGVNIEVYDYQQKLITSGSTDANGWVNASYDRKPYLVIAKQGNQRGYLRIDDGSALSMSRFDTRGQTYNKGVKGFIYGERGVWRPGDQIYLSFILEDKNQSLPTGHPVIFELFDPRGQLIDKAVSQESKNGFYAFPTKTESDAVTGNYTAKVSVGGSTFRKNVKVETVVPNRLKMAFDFGRKYLSNQTTDLTADLQVNWLHGAVAKSMKADVRATLQSTPTKFGRFGDYIFDDPVRKFYSEEKTLFDGKLDENGLAKVQANISGNESAPGKLVANFKTKVFEPGGGFSVDRFSIPFHPYDTYVGIKTPKGDAARGMLLTDEDHTINIASVDKEGNPVSTEVTVTLYKLSWKWWWDKSQDNIGTYKGKVSGTQLQTGTIQTTNGNGTWTLNVKYPDWGRYLIRAVDQNGHATGKIVYIDWPGWAGRAMDEGQGGAQMLTFTSEKNTYRVGEEVKLNIPTGASGRALVSLESGSKVIKSYWVNATEGTTRFSFNASSEMAPNIYVNVTLIQPHAQTANDRPIRLYGVIPIKVEDPQTRLEPVLAMNDVLEPMTSVDINVSENGGLPMTYTLAVVDEGLLGLTRYQTPDPWSTFYQREALGVKTWDIYDHVLGAYGGEIKSLLGIGGGADSEGPDGKKPDRFKPVVKFLGPFELKKGQTNKHTISMPNYIGAVRTMVVAGDGKGAYGRTEKSTPVKKSLMVLGSLPRVVGPGESVRLPVTVFANEDNIRVVNVNVQTGKRMLVDGKETKIMRFYDVGEQMTSFDLGVLSSLGKTSVKITATAGNEVAVYETDIEVRNPNPRITEVYSKVLEKGDDWKQSYTPVGMRGTNYGVLEVSSIPPINLGKRLQYLIQYPYGCIEQTTSGAFPQVYLADLLDLSSKQKEEVDKNIRAGIKRLKNFQLPDGGMAYWPGNGDANQWGTNYAGHFLLEAEKAGYTLPENWKTNWTAYQKKTAQNWSDGNGSDELTQAYRLYLLALAGSPELGAMNRMRQRSSMATAAKWNLAAAYHLAGQKEVAKKVIKGLGVEVNEYQELSGTYGSQPRDQAVILQALSIIGDRAKATPLAQTISAALSSDAWMNTQATAYSLVAMAKFVGKGGSSSKMKFSYKVGKDDWKEVNVSSPVWQVSIDDLQRGELQIKNKSGSLIYPRLILEGIPLKGDTSNASNGLDLKVAYYDMNGNQIQPDKLEQGTDFVAKVTVKNTGLRTYEEMALNQIFPSGWEIHNIRLDGSNAGGSTPEYQDIRDDRVYTFFDLNQGQSKTFHVMLNASYPGRYYLPAVTAEAMYDHSINGRQSGRWVEVKAGD